MSSDRGRRGCFRLRHPRRSGARARSVRSSRGGAVACGCHWRHSRASLRASGLEPGHQRRLSVSSRSPVRADRVRLASVRSGDVHHPVERGSLVACALGALGRLHQAGYVDHLISDTLAVTLEQVCASHVPTLGVGPTIRILRFRLPEHWEAFRPPLSHPFGAYFGLGYHWRVRQLVMKARLLQLSRPGHSVGAVLVTPAPLGGSCDSAQKAASAVRKAPRDNLCGECFRPV